MVKNSSLVDQFGRPIERDILTREIAAANTTGVRNPYAGYPADGLTPLNLANILKSAAQSDPLQYFELAEIIEERDLHYAGVMGTRKRSVAQIDITVEAGSDTAEDEARADMVRNWLKRDELQDEIFNILDAVGKGVSFTEIIWDTSEGQFWPKRLEWRDQRYFTFDRTDWSTPMLRDIAGHQPLVPYKFIYGRIQAKSGLPIRGGIARMAAWAWMFKAYTQRDWAVFTQTYGQPIRVGKYGAGATKDERDTLYRAVANIAGDCAAIMPDSMTIDFIEAKNISGSTDHYERRANWFDMQVSKGVLGQTTTTDAVSGGHAVAREHRLVQEDIERADAKALSAILNRDLIRPFIDLNDGPQKFYPRLVIARPEKQDVDLLITAVEKLSSKGLRVGTKHLYGVLGIPEPQGDEEVLSVTVAPPVAETTPANDKQLPKTDVKKLAGLFASFSPKVVKKVPDQVEDLVASASPFLDDATGILIDHIRALADEATSLQDLQAKILLLVPDVPEAQLAAAMGEALVLANLAGRERAGADPTP